MIPMPIIGEPFKRVAMDIVGPLPKTSSGKQFILVVSDYATRYPKAFPLSTISAPAVAEKLVELFSCHGVPAEILTDQGANFTSLLLQEIYRLIGVKAITTSPYHPQTDGLVERFNKTLKLMLKKVLEKERRAWDKMLPLVLFAYREVPQESTGFSPFELIYSRDVRGPLDILKEAWIPEEEPRDDIAQYISRLHERMATATDLVHHHLQASQIKQKQWYDQHAREQNLQPGDRALLLLPDSTHKFTRKWQGPYIITKQLGQVNYEVQLERQRKVFHVNLLRKWHQREAKTSYVSVIEDEEELEGYLWEEGEPRVGEQLSKDEVDQLWNLLYRYKPVIQSKPGRTQYIMHRIHTGDSNPVRQRPSESPQH